MEKASIEPPEEEEEERPIVNGNGVAVTPGEPRQRPPQPRRDSRVRGPAPGRADVREVMLLFMSQQWAPGGCLATETVTDCFYMDFLENDFMADYHL